MVSTFDPRGRIEFCIFVSPGRNLELAGCQIYVSLPRRSELLPL